MSRVSALSDTEKTISFIINCVNLVAACISLFLTMIYILQKGKNFHLLPKSLRWYMNVCFFPSVISFAIGSIYLGVSYLRHGNVDLFVFKIVRLILANFAQLLRVTFLFLMFERVIATVYLEKYTSKISHIILAAVLTVLSWMLSILHTVPNVMWIFFAKGKTEFETMVYVSLALHVITLILCKILHYQNQKMYKLLAYRVSLHRRHQIVENIKILKFLWPTIFIFSVVAPLGPISTSIYVYFTGKTAPSGLFHMWYNTTISLIFIFNLKFISLLRNSNSNADNTQTIECHVISVVSPLGTNLPTTLPTEDYFNSLKEEWK